MLPGATMCLTQICSHQIIFTHLLDSSQQVQTFRFTVTSFGFLWSFRDEVCLFFLSLAIKYECRYLRESTIAFMDALVKNLSPDRMTNEAYPTI
jgi:hypothetical protein